jgi:hypothetical protein
LLSFTAIYALVPGTSGLSLLLPLTGQPVSQLRKISSALSITAEFHVFFTMAQCFDLVISWVFFPQKMIDLIDKLHFIYLCVMLVWFS